MKLSRQLFIPKLFVELNVVQQNLYHNVFSITFYYNEALLSVGERQISLCAYLQTHFIFLYTYIHITVASY